MPAYVAEPAVQTYPPFTIQSISPGVECYSFGSSAAGYNSAASQAAVTNYSITSNVVTFTLSYGFTSQFAANRTVVISGVAAPDDFLNNTYTIASVPTTTSITVPLTHSNVTSTAIVGLAVQSAQPLTAENAETIPANGTAGAQFAVRSFPGTQQNSGAITWETILTGATVVDIRLQGAVRDVDSEYFDVDKSTVAAGEARTVSLGSTKVNFLRIKVVSTTTAGTIIAKFVV